MQCAFWFFPQRLSETFLILRRSERDAVINVQMYRFNFSDRLSKNAQILIFIKIRAKPSCSMRTDEANSRLSQFCESA
jgi:hypothetical protein